MRRDTGLLPQPVRTAQTEMTGTLAANCVCSAPSSQKSAPAATARDARCIERWIRHIAVGEHRDINVLVADDFFHPVLFDDRNAHGITRAGQLRRIMSSCNVWDLGCGEGDYFKFRVVTEYYVEIMKISSSSTKDEDSFHFL